MAELESWEDADDEDDWAVTALPADDGAPAPAAAPVADGGDDEWLTKAKAPAPAPAPKKPAADDRPLILVNFTALSDGAIHNRNDPHACNDPEAKSALAKKIAADYARYAGDGDLVARGVVRASGTSCWRAALAELRAAQPGQFWAPVFPPT
jgi:hypothetical protein